MFSVIRESLRKLSSREWNLPSARERESGQKAGHCARQPEKTQGWLMGMFLLSSCSILLCRSFSLSVCVPHLHAPACVGRRRVRARVRWGRRQSFQVVGVFMGWRRRHWVVCVCACYSYKVEGPHRTRSQAEPLSVSNGVSLQCGSSDHLHQLNIHPMEGQTCMWYFSWSLEKKKWKIEKLRSTLIFTLSWNERNYFTIPFFLKWDLACFV